MTIPDSSALMDVNAVILSPEQEKQIVSELKDKWNEGNSYFVISKSWYTSWEKYVDHMGAPRPGPIDNNDMVETANGTTQLRGLLFEGEDYVLVTQQVWETLYEWYTGGPTIPRTLICLYLSDARDHTVTEVHVAKQASIWELYDMVSAITGVPKEKARIWGYLEMRKGKRLDPLSNKSLEELGLHMEQDILLEVDGSSSSQNDMSLTGNELGLVPLKLSGSRVTALSTGDSLSMLGKGERGGLAGLVNLGNTCYMNSTLQCFAHSPPLVQYFLQDYTDDLNKDYPLGMSGELGKAFGELLKELWLSGRKAVAPRIFKTKLERCAPQFSGYRHQDSIEVHEYLIDGVHEYLNKVKRKPYIELKDSDSGPNGSVNVFKGQYKSSLVCPVCKNESIQLETFTDLSLPLPSTFTRSITVTVFYRDGSHFPRPYTVKVPRFGSCRDLIAALRTECSLTDNEGLLLAEVFEHKISRYFENPEESLSLIRDDDHIVAYRMNKSDSSVDPDLRTRVLVEWNNNEHENYDSSYLSDLPEVYTTSFSAKETRPEAISLLSCLEEFLAEEPLGDDNMWTCSKCKENSQAMKKLQLLKLPDILVFHFKRFMSTKYFRKKTDTFVNFPINDLDMSKYVKDKSGLYELYAVSNHYGGTDSGHYTAYAKLIDDNKWYRYNDSHVSPINESEIESSAAYILFYRRVGSEKERESAEVSSTVMD